MKNALKEGRVERGTDLFGFSVNLLFLRFSLSFYSVTSLRNKSGKSKFYRQKIDSSISLSTTLEPVALIRSIQTSSMTAI